MLGGPLERSGFPPPSGRVTRRSAVYFCSAVLRAAIESIAGKLGCTAETLRKWVRQAERDSGLRGGLTTAERQRVKELEREVCELKRTNEILRKASAYFAQAELDRRPR